MKSIITTPYTNAAFYIICVLVAFTPLARGSVHPWATTLIQISILIALIFLAMASTLLSAHKSLAWEAGSKHGSGFDFGSSLYGHWAGNLRRSVYKIPAQCFAFHCHCRNGKTKNIECRCHKNMHLPASDPVYLCGLNLKYKSRETIMTDGKKTLERRKNERYNNK